MKDVKKAFAIAGMVLSGATVALTLTAILSVINLKIDFEDLMMDS